MSRRIIEEVSCEHGLLGAHVYDEGFSVRECEGGKRTVLTEPSPEMVERAAEAAIEAFCVTIGLSSDWIATTEDQRTRWRHIGGAAVTAALFPDMDIASLGLPDLTAPESDAYYKEMSEMGTGTGGKAPLAIDQLLVEVPLPPMNHPDGMDPGFRRAIPADWVEVDDASK